MSTISLKRVLDDENYNDAPPPKKAATTKKKAAVGHAAGYCSLSKKDFGDKIKSCLALEKYAVQRTRINLEMDTAFFRSFFGSVEGIKFAPEVYDDTSPVIVATLGNRAAGQVFGVSKVKNGNRYQQYDLSEMVVILYPATKKA